MHAYDTHLACSRLGCASLLRVAHSPRIVELSGVIGFDPNKTVT